MAVFKLIVSCLYWNV